MEKEYLTNEFLVKHFGWDTKKVKAKDIPNLIDIKKYKGMISGEIVDEDCLFIEDIIGYNVKEYEYTKESLLELISSRLDDSPKYAIPNMSWRFNYM